MNNYAVNYCPYLVQILESSVVCVEVAAPAARVLWCYHHLRYLLAWHPEVQESMALGIRILETVTTQYRCCRATRKLGTQFLQKQNSKKTAGNGMTIRAFWSAKKTMQYHTSLAVVECGVEIMIAALLYYVVCPPFDVIQAVEGIHLRLERSPVFFFTWTCTCTKYSSI